MKIITIIKHIGIERLSSIYSLRYYRLKAERKYWSKFEISERFTSDDKNSYINNLINSFWADIFNKNRGKSIRIKLTVIAEHYTYNSFTKACIINYKDKDILLNLAHERWDAWEYKYKGYFINTLFIDYKVLDEKTESFFHNYKPLKKLDIDLENLPNTMDLDMWSNKPLHTGNIVVIRSVDHLFIFELFESHYKCKVSSIDSFGESISFEDHLLDRRNPSLDSFKRIISTQLFTKELTYIDGILVKSVSK